jgi:hypothetical protein
VAPALVGSPSAYSGGNTAQTSIACTLAQATTAGSILVATVGMGTSATPSTSVSSISGGGTWAQVASDNPAGRKDSSEIWWTAPTAGTTSVTVNLTASCAVAGHVYEFSGCNTSSPFDQGGGTDGSSLSPVTPSETTTVAAEALVAIINQGSSSVTVSSPTAGWTATAQQVAHPTGATAGETSAYQIVSSTGTYSFGATLSASAIWSASIATFKASSGTSAALAGTSAATGAETATPSTAVAVAAEDDGAGAMAATSSVATALAAASAGAGAMTAATSEAVALGSSASGAGAMTAALTSATTTPVAATMGALGGAVETPSVAARMVATLAGTGALAGTLGADFPGVRCTRVVPLVIAAATTVPVASTVPVMVASTVGC